MSDENANPNNFKSTPPTNKKVRNPFDKALIGRLHKPICSPGMCKVYKKQRNGHFWDIDQACSLVPQDIVPCNSQFEPSPDPAMERIAEEATEKFFSQEMVMPSPLESSKKVKPLQTSIDPSVQISSTSIAVAMQDASAQTVLTLPPELPPLHGLENLLARFFTFTMEQSATGDYEMTANGPLRRKLLFEEHSDHDEELTDDDERGSGAERGPEGVAGGYEAHTPVVFSPEIVSRDMAIGMKRTFVTPLKQGPSAGGPPYRNKIFDNLDGEPFSPIHFHTPKRTQSVATPTSFASTSISPVKTASSDEEKYIFNSPESEAMATCLDCIATTESDKKRFCFCKTTPEKLILTRSASLKESPKRKTSYSFSEKRSLSMSSLHRSRSVQKLDFSMEMSVDGSVLDHSQADSESSPTKKEVQTWSPAEHISSQLTVTPDSFHSANSFKQPTAQLALDETPVKGKSRPTKTHEIIKIRPPKTVSPLHMSLDNSTDDLNLEHKRIDFNNVDLKFLTENSQFDYTKGDSSSFKRVDSGFNEHTFYTNASSYYESAIKPSELTVTNAKEKGVLKEISNLNWMRVDSGFNENSGDSVLYPIAEGSTKKPEFTFTAAKFADKENDFDKFLIQAHKNEAMSMSDIFNEDMTFNCNFSSTPSKNKPRPF